MENNTIRLVISIEPSLRTIYRLEKWSSSAMSDGYDWYFGSLIFETYDKNELKIRLDLMGLEIKTYHRVHIGRLYCIDF